MKLAASHEEEPPAQMTPSRTGLVRRTVAVLRTVASRPGGAGLSEVARASGVNKATCHRILGELEQERLVRVDHESRKYFLGFGMFALAGALLGAGGVADRVRSSLDRLAMTTGETTGIDVLIDDGILVAMQVQGPQLIGQASRPTPRVLPPVHTSTGKVLLAWCNNAELVVSAVREGGPRADGRKIGLAAFEKELALVRDRGYGTAVDELEVGASAVARPVFMKDDVVAAVWVGGPSFRLTPDRIPEVSRALKPVAEEVGAFLSAQGQGIQSLIEPLDLSGPRSRPKTTRAR